MTPGAKLQGMRFTLALLVVVLVTGCEDDRRAYRGDRRARRSPFGSQTTNSKIDDLQAKLDDLQTKLNGADLSTGAYECDELIRLTLCSYDKLGSSGSTYMADAKKAFTDAAVAWREALQNSATRQATIDACKMSLDAARSGFNSSGCY